MAKRLVHQAPIAETEEIPENDRSRCLLGKPFGPRRGGVQALLERLEVERAAASHDDLAVHGASLGQLREQGSRELGKVPVERLVVAAPDPKLGAVAKDQRAKAIPLGLEEPPIALRQGDGALGEHRKKRRADGQGHGRDGTWAARLPPASAPHPHDAPSRRRRHL